MDTFGNFSLPANRLPVKCEHCRMPNLDAVPEPYLLSRGIDAPGDFSTAELGNFLVRDRARHVLEIAAPGACRYFPTFNVKSKEPTDWLLAVPQTAIVTAKLPEKFVQCSACGEAKAVSHLEPLEFSPPEVDLFKSRQWTCSKIGEETPWYLEGYLKTTRDKLPRHQWTRLGLDRELWFSTRLLLLMKACKLKGCYASALENRKPTPLEAGWIKQQLDRIGAVNPSGHQSMPGAADAVDAADTARWLRSYLSENATARPLASRQTVADWEQKHGITLPQEYVDFVATVGRHSFTDMFGMEGYSVRILGPKQLDDRTFRRDRPQDASQEAEPDGLMFAAAINGDCLCFDLAGPVGKYVVYHFDHETSAFTAFAADFSQAVRRLVERS
jgi:hypothetical protein